MENHSVDINQLRITVETTDSTLPFPPLVVLTIYTVRWAQFDDILEEIYQFTKVARQWSATEHYKYFHFQALKYRKAMTLEASSIT